jgi:AcrR family transcriptional regulator
MPRPRFERLEHERRRRLLAAAAEEFAAHGFSGASLGRISAAAAFSKAALYYYFEDKADLYAGVVEEAWRAVFPADPPDLEALGAGEFWPELRRLYLEMLERSRREAWLPAAGALIYDPAPAPGVGEVVEALFARARCFLGRVIERGQQLGCVRDDLPSGLLQELVMALAQSADRWMVRHWSELPPEAIEATALGVSDLFERLLRGVAAP